jgi:ribosomal protein S18 acetylase RimI-like enzyme
MVRSPAPSRRPCPCHGFIRVDWPGRFTAPNDARPQDLGRAAHGRRIRQPRDIPPARRLSQSAVDSSCLLRNIHTMHIRAALLTDAEAISAVAAQTFALACPAGTPEIELQKYIRENLTPPCFELALADPKCDVQVLVNAKTVIGFSLVNHAPESLNLPLADGIAELTRCYVLPAYHGTGCAQRLLDATLASLPGPVRLTVNDQNAKAIRFYTRNGFATVGATSFRCGDDIHRDLVMVRRMD